MVLLHEGEEEDLNGRQKEQGPTLIGTPKGTSHW